MQDEAEWWKEDQDDYDTRLESMRIGLNRLWNEVCYLTDEHKLNFSDVGTLLMMCYNDAILLEIQELEETEEDNEPEEDDDYDDDDE